MKYGLIKYKAVPIGREEQKDGDISRFNIGDNIQMIALKRIYTEEMNISETEIVEIDFHELGVYKGEYLILPINLFFFGCHDAKETWFPCSPYIIPVFIGLHLSSSYLSKKEIDYFNRYSPIGCRDSFTLNTMRNYGIESYLFGCITATLPKRQKNVKDNLLNRKTTFLVDVDSEEVIKRLPSKYKENIEVVSHEFEGYYSTDNYKKADQTAKKVLEKYRNDGALVVTSRLHCASPCIAMGIPTIMIVKERSTRFSWLNKLIPIYTINEYDNIDWEVGEINYEELKNKMIANTIKRIGDCVKKYSDAFAISSFFEESSSKDYKDPFEDYKYRMRNIINDNIKSYYIWGATVLAEETYLYMKEYKPDLKFLGLIDEYNKLEFNSTKSVSFAEVEDLEKCDLIFATPSGAKKYIKEKLLSSNYKGYVLFADGELVHKKNK